MPELEKMLRSSFNRLIQAEPCSDMIFLYDAKDIPAFAQVRHKAYPGLVFQLRSEIRTVKSSSSTLKRPYVVFVVSSSVQIKLPEHSAFAFIQHNKETLHNLFPEQNIQVLSQQQPGFRFNTDILSTPYAPDQLLELFDRQAAIRDWLRTRAEALTQKPRDPQFEWDWD